MAKPTCLVERQRERRILNVSSCAASAIKRRKGPEAILPEVWAFHGFTVMQLPWFSHPTEEVMGFEMSEHWPQWSGCGSCSPDTELGGQGCAEMNVVSWNPSLGPKLSGGNQYICRYFDNSAKPRKPTQPAVSVREMWLLIFHSTSGVCPHPWGFPVALELNAQSTLAPLLPPEEKGESAMYSCSIHGGTQPSIRVGMYGRSTVKR